VERPEHENSVVGPREGAGDAATRRHVGHQRQAAAFGRQPGAQLLGIQRARPVQAAEDPAIDHGREHAPDRGNVLVGQDPRDSQRAPGREQERELIGEDPGGCLVVGHIEDPFGLTRDPLEPATQPHRRERPPQTAWIQPAGQQRGPRLEQGRECGDCGGRVIVLDPARQPGHRQVGEVTSPAMPCPGRPCHGAGPEFDMEVPPRGSRDRPPLGHPLQDRVGHRGGAENGGPPGTEYSGFLAPDILERRPEPIGVIQPDRADHGHVCIDDIGRIQAPAQSHLDHGEIHCGVTEDVIGGQRAVFEESKRDFAALGLDALEGFKQQPLIDRLAVERDPLRVPHEVG